MTGFLPRFDMSTVHANVKCVYNYTNQCENCVFYKKRESFLGRVRTLTLGGRGRSRKTWVFLWGRGFRKNGYHNEVYNAWVIL